MSTYKEKLDYLGEKDGFSYGEITVHFYEDGLKETVWGDAAIKTPDNTYIDIDWELSDEPYAVLPEDAFVNNINFLHLGFTKPIKTIDDLIFNFHSVLPFVKEIYENEFKKKSE